MEALNKNLKKLVFRLWNSSAGGSKEGASTPIELAIIYGIGPGGLSDFERAIGGLELHESLELEIESGRLRSYMGSIYGTLCHHLDLTGPAAVHVLNFELIAINTPEPKEVVTAMAQLQKYGCGGSDCGCGCH